jgi:frataxin-like iron-binding protein CyaY
VYPKFIGLVKDGGPKPSATRDKPYAQRAAREINCDNGGEHRGFDERGKRMDEQDFRRKSDAELESLKRRLLELGDEHGFEVEGSGERLELLFETETESGEPEEVRFVISPNTAARQIWISALDTSFKLAWSQTAGAFKLEKTDENLREVMGRILTQQLGKGITV